MIAGTTPKPHIRSRPICHIPILIRPGTNFLTSSPKSAQSKIKTQRNGITCMQLTSPKVAPPPSEIFFSCGYIRIFEQEGANHSYVGLFRPSHLKCRQNHLTICVLLFYGSLSIFRRDYDKGKQNRLR